MKYLKIDPDTMCVVDDADKFVKVVHPTKLERIKTDLLAKITRANADIANIDALLAEWDTVNLTGGGK